MYQKILLITIFYGSTTNYFWVLIFQIQISSSFAVWFGKFPLKWRLETLSKKTFIFLTGLSEYVLSPVMFNPVCFFFFFLEPWCHCLVDKDGFVDPIFLDIHHLKYLVDWWLWTCVPYPIKHICKYLHFNKTKPLKYMEKTMLTLCLVYKFKE